MDHLTGLSRSSGRTYPFAALATLAAFAALARGPPLTWFAALTGRPRWTGRAGRALDEAGGVGVAVEGREPAVAFLAARAGRSRRAWLAGFAGFALLAARSRLALVFGCVVVQGWRLVWGRQVDRSPRAASAWLQTLSKSTSPGARVAPMLARACRVVIRQRDIRAGRRKSVRVGVCLGSWPAPLTTHLYGHHFGRHAKVVEGQRRHRSRPDALLSFRLEQVSRWSEDKHLSRGAILTRLSCARDSRSTG